MFRYGPLARQLNYFGFDLIARQFGDFVAASAGRDQVFRLPKLDDASRDPPGAFCYPHDEATGAPVAVISVKA